MNSNFINDSTFTSRPVGPPNSDLEFGGRPGRGLVCPLGDRLVVMESGHMGSLKKNGLAILGWSVFVGLYFLFVKLFYEWFVQQIPLDSAVVQTKPLLIIAFLYLSIFVLGFFAFAISLRLLVFPIIQRETAVSVKLKYPLIAEWLIFFIVFVFLSLPIGLVEDLLHYTELSDAMIEMVKPVWQACLSLWFYRKNVLTYSVVQNESLDHAEVQVEGSV
jgi:hypothetical protein